MKARIIYKICLLTYKALKFGEPKYLNEYTPFGLETSVAVRHMPVTDIGSLSQELSVAVEIAKDPFNIVHQDYIINCQW